MRPTSFEFTLTMPADARLLGAVRELAIQSAGYAQLPADSVSELADQVEQATRTAVAATRAQTRVEVRFSATADTVDVTISCDAPPSAQTPESVSSPGVTVDWTRVGSRYTCQIRQRIPA